MTEREQGKNSLPEPYTPEFERWIRGNIDVLENRAEMLRKKLRKAGLLKLEDISFNPNAPHKVWQYRKQEAKISYKKFEAIFENKSITLSVTYGDLNDSFTIDKADRALLNPRKFSYLKYRSADTFQFSVGGFGGGYFPEELIRAHADDSGQFSFRYGRSGYYHHDPEYHYEPEYIQKAFGLADVIIDEVDASRPMESIPERNSFGDRFLRRIFSKS